jgi:hypothetical protein
MGWLGWAVLGIVAVVVVVLLVVRPWRGLSREALAGYARQAFQAERPQLEAQFFQAASTSGKPRGLRWKSLEWDTGMELAREAGTGRLAALVGVTIEFEAIEGSDMEGLSAVGNLRNASAVFFFHNGRWHTLGRTVFNMNPAEAIAHFKYEHVPS